MEASTTSPRGPPLEGIDLLPPAEASERLTELGICHEFNYSYDFVDRKKDRGIGTSERWCTMPDVVSLREVDGSATTGATADGQAWRGQMKVLDNGHVRISVADLEPRDRRMQPPAGGNCPTY